MSGVYDVFVKISMTNGVSPGLALISKEVLGLNVSVSKLTKAFNEMSTGAKLAFGGAAIAGGAALAVGLEKAADKGNELVRVQRSMVEAGVKVNEVQAAYNKALATTAQFKNMSVVESLKMINDARGVFGDQTKATEEGGTFVGAASFLKAYDGGKHNSDKSIEAEIMAAIKSGEIAGKVTPEEMKSHIGELLAMKVAFGEQLKIGQYLTAQRAAGVALRNTSDEFRYGMFPALVQENGSGAGTMLMTAFNKIVAGVGNRTQSLEEMFKMGLLNREDVKFDKAGRAIGLKDPDGIKNSREAAMNFGSWVMTTLKPLLDKKTGGDPIKEAQEISKMFPDRNAAKAITEILQQFTKLTKDAELIRRVNRDYQEYSEGSYDYQKQAFSAQLDNTITLMGSALVGPATEALKAINEQLSNVVQWMAKVDPTILQRIGYGIAALALALTAGGAVAIVAALGPAGWVTAGFIALGAAFAMLHERFGPIVSALAMLLPGGVLYVALYNIKDIFATMANLVERLAEALKSLESAFGSALGAVQSFVSALSGGLGLTGPGSATPGKGVGSSVHPGTHSPNPSVGPPGKQSMNVTTNLNIDGKQVAQLVEKHIVNGARYPTRAPMSDGFATPSYG